MSTTRVSVNPSGTTVVIQDAAIVGGLVTEAGAAVTAAEAARDEAVAAATASESARDDAQAAAAAAAADAASINGDVAASAANAASAAGSAATATTQAGIATTQAGIATTQAGIATGAANQAVAAVGNSQTFKTLVDVAPTVPLTAQSGTPIIDGVQTSAGMRVLDWNNPDQTKRGVYVVAAGAWSRSADADSPAKISGMSCVVVRGDTHFGRQFNCVTSVNTLGTDPITFVPEFSGATELTARARQAFGAYIIFGDSNTVGRNGTHLAYYRGRGQPHQGPWRDWQHYHLADSGFKLHALAQSIATGDRNAFPTNGAYKPAANPGFGSPVGSGGGGGNIWMGVNAANAHPNSIIEICLGTNDFGLAPRNDGSGGTLAQFKKNMQEVVSFLLAVTKAQIVLRIPQPFGGLDFIQGVNVTQWASDSPDGTAAGGAAARSAEMISVYRQWVGRNPRVSVFDAPRLVYGADRCDDPGVNCMDLQIPANYKGKTITTAQRALISDSLHASDLGKRREEEALMQFYGLSSGRPHVDHNLFLGPMFTDWQNIVEGEWFYFEAMSNSGADTSFRVRPSPENLAWGTDLFSVLNGVVNVYGPTHELMREGERMLLMKRLGALKRIIAWRKEVKFFFPATGNTYTASDIVFSSSTTDSDPFASQYFTLFAKNVNMGAELAAAQGPDIGVTGVPAQDKSRQRVLIYVTEFDSLPEIRRPVGLTVVGTLGCSPDPYNDVSGESWVARTFRCVRTDNSPTTPTITLSIFNLSDGRLVDGSVNFGTGEGMPIGTFTFSSGGRIGTWTPNTANIDAAIAAGIGWKGVAGSNWVTMKSGYGFRAKVDSALGNPAQITISN